VPPLAVGLVLVAAVLHAGWNVLLKTSGDPLRTAMRLQAIGTAILVPIGVAAWFLNGRPAIEPAGVALASVSGVIEALYFICLSAAYARGDLSLVYPLARGSAPLVAILVGIGVLGERLALPAAAGVACLVIGILLVARPWRALREAGREHRGAIGFALLTGALIAAYSTVDRLGVRIIVPWVYGSILAVVATSVLWSAMVVGRRVALLGPPPGERRNALSSQRPGTSLLRDGATGVVSLVAYLLVLFAYSIAPLAGVAPLRESGIVLAAAWGALKLGEARAGGEALLRIGAAGLVVAGAVLLAVSR